MIGHQKKVEKEGEDNIKMQRNLDNEFHEMNKLLKEIAYR